jgi:hypothetical protein
LLIGWMIDQIVGFLLVSFDLNNPKEHTTLPCI